MKRNQTREAIDKRQAQFRENIPLHMMLILPLGFVLVFSYGPMAGLVMAFQDFIPVRGWFRSAFVGLENFREMLFLPSLWKVIRNTVFISVMKIITGQSLAILVTLMLFKMYHQFLARTVQTIIYLPHFMSWVIMGGILIEMLAIDTGAVNQMLRSLGQRQISFLGNPNIFPWTLILSEVWKEFGYATIIYFAALSAVDPGLYEAAEIDGAGVFRQAWNVSIPGIAPTIVLVLTLSMGSLLSAGFEQVYNLYNPVVYSTGDILDTLIYRLGISQARFSLAAAVGICKSFVSMILISGAYFFAYKFANYRIF
jgi:putative aldouronate transport system permease protein